MNQILLNSKEAKKTAIQAIQSAPDTHICIIKNRNRTAEQNSLYWKIIQDICEESTLRYEEKKCTKDQIHLYFALSFLEPKEITLFDGSKTIKRKSTTELSTKEFMDYLEAIFVFCGEMPQLQYIPEKYAGPYEQIRKV